MTKHFDLTDAHPVSPAAISDGVPRPVDDVDTERVSVSTDDTLPIEINIARPAISDAD